MLGAAIPLLLIVFKIKVSRIRFVGFDLRKKEARLLVFKIKLMFR